MDKKEIFNKRIDVLRDIKNNLWYAAIASITGTITLSFNHNYSGILVSLGFVNGYIKKYDQIENLINKMSKEILK